MKSLIEAAIAILIVYLLLEYFKNNQSSSAGGGGSAAVGTASAASASGCCCGGGGAASAAGAPKVNVFPVGPIGYSPITNIGFGSTPAVVPIASVPPSPAPVPRVNYSINA